MLCTRCRTRTAVTADDLCTFCSGTRPPLPGGLMAPVPGPGGWTAGAWPRSPVALARAVTVLLGVVIAADVFAVVTGLRVRSRWGALAEGGSPDVHMRAAQIAERYFVLAALVQGTALVVTAIVFVVWFHRTRRNAEVFHAGVQRLGPGWAIGGWFVPIANLWIPYRVASGVWEASAQTGPGDGWRTVPKTPLKLWWGAWVLSLLATRVAEEIWSRAFEPEEVARAAGLVVASDALDIVAAVLAILFVRALTRMQVERAARAVNPVPAVSDAPLK
ncbi:MULTISPECIES: DUF4328 domain-containing protein [Streptomyces]|uniref:DUF4328 domain-containing protein n=1 Tax=Streptomyces TaxID=1883 RepID=UPI0004BDA2A7|nr:MULTISPECIES: DUF4328 domain-containing protein [Streptomyces]KOG76430.1 hypothetical protein ADK33_34450 [Streptomyces griseus subsp. rhodochrous]KOU53727.1 hypothetical protein ADK56_04895 [Streptomyces sp. MMG1522]